MAGENLGGGVKPGEGERQGEYSREELQQLGEGAIKEVEAEKAEETGEGLQPNPEQGQPQGEELNQEAVEQIKAVVEASKDRYGNTMSAESIQNLQKLAVENPAAFAQEMMEWSRTQQREAAEKGYMGAQREIARLLEGRSPEEFLEVYKHDINMLNERIKRESQTIVAHNRVNQLDQYKTDEAREFQRKQLDEMRATLQEMNRKYALVANLQAGSENAVPVPMNNAEEILEIPESEEDEQTRDLRSELLDVNDPTYEVRAKVRRAEFERVTQFMSADEAERLMQQLANTEELEQQLKQEAQNNFAKTTDDDEGSDEEIRAAAAGEDGRELTYEERMSKLAQESKPGRFNDAELAPVERERLIGRLRNRLTGRKPFKKRARRAMTKLGMLLLTATIGGGALLGAMSRDDGSQQVYAAGAETAAGEQEYNGAEGEAQVVKILEQSGVTGDSAQEVAESLGISAEDLMGGELDYSQHDLLAEGMALYEGMADRESSFVAPNGMAMDMAKYNDETRHGNSFGPSIVDLKDDKEALIDAIMQNNAELPYQLAATTAAMPELLRACGVDEAIIANENVEQRAQAVMAAMEAEGGGDLQKKLAAGLNLALHNENTNVNVYQEYGLERTFYLRPFDAEKVANGEGKLELRTDVKQRNGDWQVQIEVTYADGSHDVIDLNLGCGGQVNMYTESYAVRVVITDEDNHETAIVTTNNETEEITDDEGEPDDQNPGGGQPGGGGEDQPGGEEDDEDDEEDGDEEIQKKNVEKGAEILGNGTIETGNLEKTEDVGDTGVGETTEEQDTPAAGNSEVVQEEAVTDNAQDAANQENAEENWQEDSGMSEDEENDYIDQLLSTFDDQGKFMDGGIDG